MNIFLVEKNKTTRPLTLFFEAISEGLQTKIYNKFQSYAQGYSQHMIAKVLGISQPAVYGVIKRSGK